MKSSEIPSRKQEKIFSRNRYPFPDIVIAILMAAVVVKTSVISALSLITFMRNFVAEKRVIAFVLYYIKEKTVASVMTVEQ